MIEVCALVNCETPEKVNCEKMHRLKQITYFTDSSITKNYSNNIEVTNKINNGYYDRKNKAREFRNKKKSEQKTYFEKKLIEDEINNINKYFTNNIKNNVVENNNNKDDINPKNNKIKSNIIKKDNLEKGNELINTNDDKNFNEFIILFVIFLFIMANLF